MNSSDDATLQKVTLTFTKICECDRPACMDCRSWVTESDVPFHMEGPLIPAIINTVGVDTVRLIHQRYTLITVIAGSFDPLVVLQSIKENITGLGLVDRSTGLFRGCKTQLQEKMEEHAHGQPEPGLMTPQVAEMLGRCADALTFAAETMEDQTAQVIELEDDTIVYDGRRFLQIHPQPPGRSWLRRVLLRWILK